MDLRAKWIWHQQKEKHPYNQTIIAKKSFSVDSVNKASMAITADSFYRLIINGEWVNDGPCRSWPSHFQYDEFDITPYLKEGKNELTVIARYFGVGTFHQIPQKPGLLVQLEATRVDGSKETIVSDETWKTALAQAWISNTSKVCCQMEATEVYDARLEKKMRHKKAAVVCDTNEGPWKDLNPRDTALLTKKPVSFRKFLGANVVRSDWSSYTFLVSQLLYPGLIEQNRCMTLGHSVATVIVAESPLSVEIASWEYLVTINGDAGKESVYQLKAGENLLLATARNLQGHLKEGSIRFLQQDGYTLKNPLKSEWDNPWCYIPTEAKNYAGDDMNWHGTEPEFLEAIDELQKELQETSKKVTDLESFKSLLGKKAKCPPSEKMIAHEYHAQFFNRESLGDGLSFVENPTGLMHDNCEYTTVSPSPTGDVELVYDLGQQDIGYYDFQLQGEEGLILDIYAVENIFPSGNLQHTYGNRNGMRYHCREGLNKFTSTKRRSGRFLFITLRNQTKPVGIRLLQVIESTYPVDYQGSFSCSDARLDQIWEISARTLKLCMEDTFTDCPLYEQTLWVGDARNEAVFAYTVFGATDLSKRCIRLAGQSLERFPITGCQVPSSWDCLLPAWSFLWGLSVWDYYFYSGDQAFLDEVWPWVIQNLKGAEGLLDEHGLFSGPYWNMFDWADSDCGHNTVLHNSMFVVGAIDAAVKCSKVLKDKEKRSWLKGFRSRLVKSINSYWDYKKGAYPDSIHSDGELSDCSSVHTSFLSLLYDIVPAEHKQQVLKNMLKPPRGMVTVGSPFAIMYLYEALDKEGLDDEIIQSIYTNYVPMLEAGATTVWETFPSGNIRHGEGKTRSHCHAWSSAPVFFLNKIVLGIHQESPGGKSYVISPRLCDLQWAKGTCATINGAVEVRWHLEAKKVIIEAKAPAGVNLTFKQNDSLVGREVIYNGQRQ